MAVGSFISFSHDVLSSCWPIELCSMREPLVISLAFQSISGFFEESSFGRREVCHEDSTFAITQNINSLDTEDKSHIDWDVSALTPCARQILLPPGRKCKCYIRTRVRWRRGPKKHQPSAQGELRAMMCAVACLGHSRERHEVCSTGVYQRAHHNPVCLR